MANIENPLAYSFLMQEDIFLLDADKQSLKAGPLPGTEPVAAQPVIASAPEAPSVTEPPVVTENKAPGITFRYRGSNNAQYLIIVNYADEEFMAETHFAALAATLKRLGIDADDTAIFNLAKHSDAEFKHITGFFKPQKMLILGHEALPPGLRMLPQHKPLQGTATRTLFTFSFTEMMDSAENKKAFWEAMKNF